VVLDAAGTLPLVGVTESHPKLGWADHASGALPSLKTRTESSVAVAPKSSEPSETRSLPASVTAAVTLMVAVPPFEVNLISPVWLPAERPAREI
jgi:hypothetical protein